MTRASFPTVKSAHWPALDLSLWLASQKKAGLFEPAGFAASWRPATLKGCERGYGVYLGWLAATGALDPAAHPLDRVSRDQIRGFVEAYRVGRSELTLAATLRGIAYVLRAVDPPDGIGWLTKLAHRMVNTSKPSRAKLPRMARISELVALGERLMAEGRDDLLKGQRRGAPIYRDGLMIALLSLRPLRLSNLASLRLGKTFLVDGAGIRLDIPATEMKKGVPYTCFIPGRLEQAFRFYLDKVRPHLLARGDNQDQDWLWIGRRGRKLLPNNISTRISELTLRHLGRPVSPHLFRDCAATEIALEDPAHIGITRNLLGHATLASSQKFYNQATSVTAFAHHAEVIRKLRGEE